MKKQVLYHPLAEKELKDLPLIVQKEFFGIVKSLEQKGELREPEGKKIDQNLYEMRIRVQGQWRAFYGYLNGKFILVSVFYHKKEQKARKNILKLAIKRIKEYE